MILQTGSNIGCHSYGVNTGLVNLISDQYNISSNLYEAVNKIIKN